MGVKNQQMGAEAKIHFIESMMAEQKPPKEDQPVNVIAFSNAHRDHKSLVYGMRDFGPGKINAAFSTSQNI